MEESTKLNIKTLLQKLDLKTNNPGAYGINASQVQSNSTLKSYSPIDNSLIAEVSLASDQDYEQVLKAAQETFKNWRNVPMPVRGQIVREIGEVLRENKKYLGALISYEMGKILSEGEGEIQEAIDIADYALGLSRQLSGRVLPSERKEHRMYEQWHPLGLVGVITAFNFPAAVWAWNAMIAAVCGNVLIWKPSELTPLTAIAINNLCRQVAAQYGFPGLFSLLISDGADLGKKLASDSRIPLISATGSCEMGRSVAVSVGQRLGKTILELGGNNAVIVLRDANLDLALRSVLFGAVGTAGQRCTSTRRLIIEEGIQDRFLKILKAAYAQVKIGNPLEPGILMGPLVHERAVRNYEAAIQRIKQAGGEIIYGGKKVQNQLSDLYVEPTLVLAKKELEITKEETFAPILYVISVKDLDEALLVHNNVPQGLSSSIFTNNLQASEHFLSARGSDCGIANVNLGTSGAEIGGAFGGEKDTGGGRESGSDSWKQYMRRQTSTVNYGKDLPLAQGVQFEVSFNV